MNIKDLLKEDSVILYVHNKNKEEAIERMIDKHFECQHIHDKEAFQEAIYKREKLSSTGVGNMIAIPHAQDDSVDYPSLVAMVDKEGVDFQSLDNQPAKIFFMIAVPKDGGSKHLEILAQLSQILMNEQTVQYLLNAYTPKNFIDILCSEMEEPVQEVQPIIKKETSQDKPVVEKLDVIAVTACPTGIAHTYMAAKSLEETAKKMGIHIKVETNGASGIKNKLTQEDINQAKCVIVAADKKVEMERFSQKRIIQVPVAKGIHNAEELLEEAMNQEENIEASKQPIQKEKSVKENIFKKLYNHMMNGFSQIIPLLMIYGILAKITPFLTDIMQQNQVEGAASSAIANYIPYASQVSLTLALIILSSFIADSISGKSGFVVALVVSFISNYAGITSSAIIVICIGLASGYIVLAIQKLCHYLPEDLHSLIPNLIAPLVGFLIMIVILGAIPQNSIDSLKTNFSLFNDPILSVILGLVIGAMMAIDMGGPINKIAYCLGMICIFEQKTGLMCAAMIGGMIPPIMIGVAMYLSPSIFTNEERKNKIHCIIKGLCFVSEEAIPYMKNDKKGIHIPCLIASSIAGGMVMFFECGQLFPHGGIFTIFFIDNPILFLITLLASVLIGVSLIMIMKKPLNE